MAELKRNEGGIEVEDDDNDDEFLGATPAKIKKSETVVVEMPRNILKSPEVTAMFDRLKMTSNSAMGIFSTVIKASTTNGKRANLNEFSCCTSTLRRTRSTTEASSSSSQWTSSRTTKPLT